MDVKDFIRRFFLDFDARCKIKGDDGIYKVWGIDTYYRRLYIDRNCGMEWFNWDKIDNIWWTVFED